MMMRQKMLRVGIISFWLFFTLEIVTDIWFGLKFPGYKWKAQSMSFIGQSGSPLEKWVLLWGVCLTILITLFSFSFYQLYKSNKWTILAAWMLVIYGLGEGLGSGIFPIDPPGTIITLTGRLHNIFGGIGDAALILFPFVLMLIFPKAQHKKLHIYLWSMVAFGLLMISLFLLAKYFQPDNFISSYKGVWQRMYLFNYYIMLGVISWKMIRQINLE
ncbi:MAG TPA: DUF998 domain-containing protein [Saprospiraceae bacterium]|nr:DUF998 domain-containing protein [Saprospiraceae bacterium]